MSVSPRKHLRTGRSVWQRRRLPAIPHGPLARDTSTDVLVVGAGISGALVADALSDSGLRVLVADRRGPVSGSTPASTALVQSDIDMPLAQLSRRIGRGRAERAWRRSKLALDALRERIGHLGIDAGCEERSTLYLDGNVLTPTGLRDEADARRHAGFEVTYLGAAALAARFEIVGRSALLSYGSLAADPRRLTAGFLNAAVARGARIVSPVDIVDLTATLDGVIATTSSGRDIRARHMVFATGYELPRGVPRAGHTTASTWAIATRPQPRRLWPERCFIWEAADPYLYVRVGPEGRVICGGEDEPFADESARDALLAAKTATLERKLHALLPGLDTRAVDAWCGTFGASATGLPSIGPVPHLRNCYAVLGYGGNGITFAALAAQVLRAQITGAGDPDADLFSFRRQERGRPGA